MLKSFEIWNFAQRIREKVGLHPMGCTCPLDAAWSCEPGALFFCEGCSREMPYCKGGDDWMADYCDDCWKPRPDSYEPKTLKSWRNLRHE